MTQPARPRGFLQRATWSQGTLLPRFAALEPHVAGRTVLDLGCASGHWRDDWLHQKVAAVASEAVGVDLNAEWVDELCARGFALVHGDAESVRLDRTFDVVLAGELLEHLSCFAGLFDTARAHLGPEGRLVLTTPNAFGFTNFVYRLRGRPRINEDHTCWFCEDTLRQLLEKNAFVVEEISYLHAPSAGRVRARLAALARAVLPERLAWNTLIAVARPA